jgi:hypothetical protein
MVIISSCIYGSCGCENSRTTHTQLQLSGADAQLQDRRVKCCAGRNRVSRRLRSMATEDCLSINHRSSTKSGSVMVKKAPVRNRTRCPTPGSARLWSAAWHRESAARPTRSPIAGCLRPTEGTPPESTIAVSWLGQPECTFGATSSNCPLLKESERSRVHMRLKSASVWLQTQGELSDDPGHAQGRLARRKWWPLLKSSDMEIVSGREIHWRYVSPM